MRTRTNENEKKFSTEWHQYEQLNVHGDLELLRYEKGGRNFIIAVTLI